jgi:hypothetical protein
LSKDYRACINHVAAFFVEYFAPLLVSAAFSPTWQLWGKDPCPKFFALVFQPTEITFFFVTANSVD